jgi:hypothetical protein
MRGMKPFEIFRTGTLTSSEGQTITFTDGDLAAIASSYNPALHEAPIVVGHPKTNMPAFGWIKGLSIKGDRLVAEPERLDPAFSELVRDGKFLKRSAAFYAPNSKGNPTPGTYHLRHVGFLGAEPPAVKGLAGVEFAEGDGEIITFAELEFADYRVSWGFDRIANMFRSIREHFIATDGLETADKLVPAFDIDQLVQAGVEMRIEDKRPSFSETTKETPMTVQKTEAERLAELEAREQAQKDRETTFSENAKKTQAEADKVFVEGVVKAGRLPIGLQGTAIALFSEMSDGVLTFSEGNTKVETSPRAAFRELLEKLPVPVVTGELASGNGPDFSDGEQYAVAIQTEIREAKAKGEELTPANAAARIKNRR